MTNSNSELLDQLQKASLGLLFMSESEAPFKTFLWESKDKEILNTESLLQKTGYPWYTFIKVVELDYFFRKATTQQNWHNPHEKENVARYQSLVEMLKKNLCDMKVYRFGRRNIDVYIVGKTPTGDYAGLATKVVETP